MSAKPSGGKRFKHPSSIQAAQPLPADTAIQMPTVRLAFEGFEEESLYASAYH